MSEKVIVSKEKLTTLGDKVRKIKGTSTKYTLDQINEELDNVSSGGESSGGSSYSSTIFLCFKFKIEEVVSNNAYVVDENNFNINISVYNNNDELIQSTYEFIGFNRVNYGSYGYTNDGMVFKINFNINDKPSYAIINFTGVTINADGIYGQGYTEANINGSVALKSNDNFYMLQYGRFTVINTSSIKYEFLTDNIYGGSYSSTFESRVGGGADD